MSFIPIITLSILAAVAVNALGNGNIVSRESVIDYNIPSLKMVWFFSFGFSLLLSVLF